MPMPIGISISALFRTIVNHEISLFLETRVDQPLILSCHRVRLYPRISTRSTQNVGKISRTTGVSKRVHRSLPWLNRLVCGVPNLFYRGHIEVKEPHMVHQKRPHWPYHCDRKTEGRRTSRTLTKSMGKVDMIPPRQH